MQELQEAIDFYVTNINNFFQKQFYSPKLIKHREQRLFDGECNLARQIVMFQ